MPDEVLNQFTPTVDKTEKIDTTKKMKVGIIGTGWIAESHIQSFKNMPDVDVVAAADLIPGKAEAFMKRFGVEGVRFYPSHKELIDNEELDAVSICTYNRQHAGPTIYALEHGINVLLEKPMCVTLDEAIEICRAEKASGKVLSIGFQPRFDANMQQIGKIVRSGALGEIYYIQTGGGRRRGIPNSTFIEDKTAGVGALGDIGCYSLDMVLNAIGYPKPLTISGYTSDFFGTSTDLIDSVLLTHFSYIRKATYNINDTTIDTYDDIFVSDNTTRVSNAMGMDYNYNISFENLETALKRAANNNEILILYAHQINNSKKDYSIEPAYLEKVFQLCNKYGLQSIRMKDIGSFTFK